MKLIFENWRKFCDLNENKQEQELDEGFKDSLLALGMAAGLGGFSPDALADTPDSGAETTQQVQDLDQDQDTGPPENVGPNYKNITVDDFKYFPEKGGNFVVYSPTDLKSQGIDIQKHIQQLKDDKNFGEVKIQTIQKDGKTFVGIINMPDDGRLDVVQYNSLPDEQKKLYRVVNVGSYGKYYAKNKTKAKK